MTKKIVKKEQANERNSIVFRSKLGQKDLSKSSLILNADSVDSISDTDSVSSHNYKKNQKHLKNSKDRENKSKK
jgi:hypothetical protein